jgi:hypothetical protein
MNFLIERHTVEQIMSEMMTSWQYFREQSQPWNVVESIDDNILGELKECLQVIDDVCLYADCTTFTHILTRLMNPIQVLLKSVDGRSVI